MNRARMTYKTQISFNFELLYYLLFLDFDTAPSLSFFFGKSLERSRDHYSRSRVSTVILQDSTRSAERVLYRFPYYPFIDGYMPRKDEDMRLNYETPGPRYFQTMRIPLVSRRDFDERDHEGAPGVVIINDGRHGAVLIRCRWTFQKLCQQIRF